MNKSILFLLIFSSFSFLMQAQTPKDYLYELRVKNDILQSRADSLYNLLQDERKKKSPRNSTTTFREQELERSYNEAMDLLSFAENALERERQLREQNEEIRKQNEEIFIQRIEEVADYAKRAADAAETIAIQRDEAIADRDKLIEKNRGFKKISGIIVEGDKSRVVIETNLRTGEIIYENPKWLNSNFTHLDYEAEWYLKKSIVNDSLSKIEGYIVIYEDNKYYQKVPSNMIREGNEYHGYHYYHCKDNAMRLPKKLSQKNQYKFVYVDSGNYDPDIIEKLSFWELCQKFPNKFLFSTEEKCERDKKGA